jgi:hypothetical protein
MLLLPVFVDLTDVRGVESSKDVAVMVSVE